MLHCNGLRVEMPLVGGGLSGIGEEPTRVNGVNRNLGFAKKGVDLMQLLCVVVETRNLAESGIFEEPGVRA